MKATSGQIGGFTIARLDKNTDYPANGLYSMSDSSEDDDTARNGVGMAASPFPTDPAF